MADVQEGCISDLVAELRLFNHHKAAAVLDASEKEILRLRKLLAASLTVVQCANVYGAQVIGEFK